MMLFQRINRMICKYDAFGTRLLFYLVSRLLFFYPVRLYAHLPSVVPTIAELKPPYPVLFVIFSHVLIIVICVLKAAKKKPSPVLYLPYIALVLYTLPLWYPMFYIVWFMFKWFFPLLAVCGVAALLLSRRGVLKAGAGSIARATVSVSCVGFLVAMEVFVVFSDCRALPRQPQVGFYVDYCDPKSQIIPPELLNSSLNRDQLFWLKRFHRSVFPDASGVYIGASEGSSFVYRPERKTVSTLLGKNGYFSVAFDRRRDRAFFASTRERRLSVVSTIDSRIFEQIDMKGIGSPYWLAFDEELERLFVGFGESETFDIIVYDTRDMTPIKREKYDKRFGSVVSSGFDPAGHRVFFSMLFNTHGGNFFGIYDLKELRITKKVRSDGYFIEMCYSPATGQVFSVTPLHSLNSALIVELDPDTLEVKKRMQVPVGSRELAVDDSGNIYLSNYLTGEIYRIDWRRGKIMDKVYVGRRIKRFVRSESTGLTGFTSERGYGFLDLGKWH